VKIIGLDNKQYSLNLVGYQVTEDKRPRSNLHLSVREFLKNFFPTTCICEEIYLPGSGGLYLDFLLPQLKIAVEAHGEQHFKYVKQFHGSPKGFMESKKRDANKKQWCSLNNISLIELTEKDKDEWSRRFY